MHKIKVANKLVSKRKRAIKAALVIGALGVVYGDIGTSPLYTINSAFFGIGQTPVTHDNILGVISIVFWLLTMVISIKYVTFVLRASYQGEGGVLALRELIGTIKKARGRKIILSFLVFGAALLLGDGIITPSISVLSAVEGLNVATNFFTPYTVIIAAATIVGLFSIQRRGTTKIGRIFGPLMIVWFFTIGLLGLVQVVHHPEILAALNPLYGFEFIINMGAEKFLLAAGAIVLAVTGAEDLYLDLGHFGRNPIKLGWFSLAYWALVLNYLGQGAFLLGGNHVIGENVFFSLVPHIALTSDLAASLPIWATEIITKLPVYAMVALAVSATVIASQALISGAFSLTSQAMALDMLPRLNIIHTSRKHRGQIYLPAVNWMLMAGCLILIFLFESSENLADAYGLAVSGVMMTTTISMFFIARHLWKWRRSTTFLVFGGFLIIDSTLLLATSLKFMSGGYIPIIVALSIFLIVLAWNWGRDLVRGAYASYLEFASPRNMEWLVEAKRRLTHDREYIEETRQRKYVELDRAVMFLVSKPVTHRTENIPIILRIFMKRHGAIPKYIVLLTIVQEKKPHVSDDKRIQAVDFDENILSVQAHYGFMQAPNGLDVLKQLKADGYMGRSLHRCTVEAAEEELFLTKGARFIDKLRIRVYLFFKSISPEAYHYFRLDAKPGMSKTIIPIVLSKSGWRIEIPEFALEDADESIDPDTLMPTSIQFARKRVD